MQKYIDGYIAFLGQQVVYGTLISQANDVYAVFNAELVKLPR